MPTNRKVVDFKIHNLTEEQFQELKDAGQIDPNAIYCTPDETEIKLAEKVDIMQGTENAGKILEVDNEGKVKPASKPSSFPLLFHTWSDCIMNNQSWLCADTFSWQSGDTYKAAYEHLVDEVFSVARFAWGGGKYLTISETPSVNDPVFERVDGEIILSEYSVSEVASDYSTIKIRHNLHTGLSVGPMARASQYDNVKTDTIGGITITYALADDGHKICLSDQESKVLELYNSTGVAWYYILDTENKRFKLPRTKYGFTGLRDEVGNYVPESLPTHTHTRGSMNITGDIGWGVNTLGDPHAGGAFTVNNSVKNAWNLPNDDNSWYVDYGFDASRAWTGSTSEPDNSVYGSGKPVQQRATQMHLYFYVGNFEQSAVEQTAGLNAELFNGKADRDLNNVPSNYDYVVATQEPTSANSYTWFRKYKSGWVEQGGRVVIYDGSAEPNRYDAKDISIPVPMKHCTNWHCQAKHDRFNAGIGQDNITTTAHIYQVNDSTSTFVNAFVIWEINGYAA